MMIDPTRFTNHKQETEQWSSLWFTAPRIIWQLTTVIYDEHLTGIWRHIPSNDKLREIFPNPPLIAYQKAKNIREIIVWAKLLEAKQSPVQEDSGFIDEEPDESLEILLSLLEEQNTV